MDAIAIPMWPDVNAGLSYKSSMVQGDIDPRIVWDRFFRDYRAPDANTPRDPRPRQRKDILSLVLEDYRSLRGKLGAGDRERLDRHLSEVESLEARIIDAPPAALSCEVPPRPPQVAANEQEFRFGAQHLEEIGLLHVDLAYYALVCDLTPVANILWGRAAGNLNYASLGISDNHHSLTHPAVHHIPDSEGKRRRIIGWYAQQLARFAQRLADTPDGTRGSVLDHTLIYWTSEISEGNGHGQSNYSNVLLGGASNAFRMGRCIDVARRPHNDVLSAIAVAFDVDLPSGRFGEYGTGPLPILA